MLLCWIALKILSHNVFFSFFILLKTYRIALKAIWRWRPGTSDTKKLRVNIFTRLFISVKHINNKDDIYLYHCRGRRHLRSGLWCRGSQTHPWMKFSHKYIYFLIENDSWYPQFWKFNSEVRLFLLFRSPYRRKRNKNLDPDPTENFKLYF